MWPSAFYVEQQRDADAQHVVAQFVTEVSSDPQTVVYQINPLAVWSNGIPITYRDFVYNWEAQSGRATFRDAGGTRFTPLDTAGYDDIANVTGDRGQPPHGKGHIFFPLP